MSKKLSPFAFIVTLVLILTSVLPSQVSASGDLSLLWEKEFNSHFLNETAATSKNETLISTYDISSDSNYNNVYTYDFMKLDATGNMIESKKLKDGQTKIFEYDGQAYVAFINNATQKFELYDENFELVSSKSISLKGDVKIKIKDDFIALTTGYLRGSGVQGIFYSLKTFKEINPSQIPIERYVGIEKYNDSWDIEEYSLVGVTFADTIVEDIPLNLSQLKGGEPRGYNDSISKFNGYFYAALDIMDKESYEDTINLFKIDLQGNIVDSLKVAADYYSYADNSIILNDKIIIAADQKYYEYDFASFSSTKSYTSGSDYPQFGKLSSEIYYYSVGNDMVFADYDGNEKYKILGLDYVQDKSNEYFVGSTGWDEVLYSVATGEKILEDPGFELRLNYDRVIATSGEYSSDYKDYTSVVKLYDKKSKEPVEETYLPNKKWTITFSKDVDKKSVSDKTIYVLDENGKKVEDLTFNTIGTKVEVNAPVAGYKTGKTYTLKVTSAVQSVKGTALKEEKSKVFTIK